MAQGKLPDFVCIASKKSATINNNISLEKKFRQIIGIIVRINNQSEVSFQKSNIYHIILLHIPMEFFISSLAWQSPRLSM